MKKETYSRQVAQIIRQMIRDGELTQGDPVQEPFLAHRLGISRAPIREALQELVYEGVVTAEPQKGKRVRLLSPKDILDSYAVGGILEAAGVGDSLSSWGEEDFAALRSVLDRMQSVSEHAAELSEMMELDDLFHTTLLQRCNNERLIEMARLSCVSISKVLCYKRWLTLFSPKGFYERHKVIADLVFAKDGDALCKALRKHYNEIGDRITQQ